MALPTQPSLPGTEENKTVSSPPTAPAADSFWDDPSVRPPSSDYAKFAVVGDTYGGTIAKLGKRVFDAGTADEHVAPELTFTEDDAPTMTAGQTLLMQALYELRPVVGDKLMVTLTKIEKRGAKTLKRFRVELTRKSTGEVQVIDQTDN
jgi:hypothetical protein